MSRLRALPLALAALLASPAFAGTGLQLDRALGGRPTDPLVAGNYIYQPTGSTLTTYDATDPAAPVVTSRTDQTPTRGAIANLASLGNGYIYAAFNGPSSETDGVAVYSLADPAHPVLVAQIAYDAEFRETGAVVAGNGQLYVFDQGVGIFRADLTDPAAPVFHNVLETFSGFTRGRIDGNLLYGIGRNFLGDYSLSIYDITDPDAPIALGGGAVPGASYVAAPLAPPYVVGIGEGLGVFDFTNPTLPMPRGSYSDGAVYYGGAATTTHAYGLGNARLDVFDITDPDTVTPGAQFPINTYLAESNTFAGTDLLVGTRVDRLVRIDVSDPAALSVRSTTILAGGSVPYDTGFNGDHTYILGNDFGMQVAHAGSLEPETLVEPDIEQVPQSRAYEEMLVDGDRTFLASWGTGVAIMDSSNPAAPVQVGLFPISFATSLAVIGDTLFVGTSTNGGTLVAVDVSNPAAPAFIGGVYTSKAIRVRAKSNLVYVADHVFDGKTPAGLRIHDAIDPANIALLSIYNTDCQYASDVVISDDGDTAYVACEDSLIILDVSDPAAPTRIGRAVLENPYAPYNSLAVRGDRAWYGTDNGLAEIDISDAANPVEVARLPLPAAPRSLRFGPDGKLYAPTGYSGLFVFDAEQVELPMAIFADAFE